MTDITELILNDHARIRRLFAALDSLVRYRERFAPTGARDCRMLIEAWERISRLLELHIAAEEEICYPAMCALGQCHAAIEASFADHEDIREALEEAQLREAGSPPWWKAVTAARAHSASHFRAEEEHVLAAFRESAGTGLRDTLARQWMAFTAARRRDAAPSAPRRGPIGAPGRIRSALR